MMKSRDEIIRQIGLNKDTVIKSAMKQVYYIKEILS